MSSAGPVVTPGRTETRAIAGVQLYYDSPLSNEALQRHTDGFGAEIITMMTWTCDNRPKSDYARRCRRTGRVTRQCIERDTSTYAYGIDNGRLTFARQNFAR